MSAAILLLRVRFETDALEHLAARGNRIRRIMNEVPGFEGFSFWQRVSDPQTVLGLYEFESPEAADEGLRAYSESNLADQAVEFSTQPMDLERILIVQQEGLCPHETGEGNILSISARLAGPGMAKKLLGDLHQVFDNLRLYPGHLGNLSAQDDGLSDEIVGIALWRDQDAFEASLPPNRSPELGIYVRSGLPPES